MDVTPIKAGTSIKSYWHEPVYYDIANERLMAQMDGNGGYSKYSVAGRFNLLEPESWFQGININGDTLGTTTKKNVWNQGKMQRIDYLTDQDYKINQELFSAPNKNILYGKTTIKNMTSSIMTIDIHLGFLIDLSSYYNYKLQTDGEARVEHPIINYKKNGLEYYVGNEYKLYFASNIENHSIDIHQDLFENTFRVHYKLIIEPGVTKDLIYALSGTDKLEYNSFTKVLSEYSSIRKEILEEIKWQEEVFDSEDEILNSMYSFALNASISSYKKISNQFEAFFAGIHYQNPPRTYFRDAYWTVLPILPYKPQWVRKQILTLANGIKEDGSCPSAVIYNEKQNKFESWWADHYDSPSFFVLMLYDYLAWTSDKDILHEKVNNNSILNHAQNALNYLIKKIPENRGLFIKPYNFNDWADNVAREGIVFYDNALFIKAIFSFKEILIYLNEHEKAKYYEEIYDKALLELLEIIEKNQQLFNYINTDGYTESNISIEWALLVIFELVDNKQGNKILDKLEGNLETKKNKSQIYGDWGVMAVYPFYKNVHHIERKSMAPYRYHNGSDWPYLDGVYSMAKLILEREDWYYPLTRWFTYSLENNWFTPVEYYGPVYGKGSDLQGWSAMPAASILMGGFGFKPDLNSDSVTLKHPKWGDTIFNNIQFRGKNYNFKVTKNRLKVTNLNHDIVKNHPFNFEETI